jgi:hypothetical protein
VRDKFTHESKGSAFVWYRTKADADRACAQLNLRRGLCEPGSGQERPLVVRRANTRKPAVPLGLGALASGGALTPPQQQQQQQQQQQLLSVGPSSAPQLLQGIGAPGGGMGQPGLVDYEPLSLMQQQQAAAAAQAGFGGYPGAPPPQQLQLQPVMLQAAGPGGVGLGLQMGGSSGGHAMVYQPVILSPAGGLLVGPGPQDCVPVSSGGNALSGGAGGPGPSAMFSGGSTLTSSAGNTFSSTLISGAATSGFMSGAPPPLTLDPSSGGGGGGSGPLRGPPAGPRAGAGADDGAIVAIQLPVGAAQMAAMTEHIYSIQMMSGAEVSSQAVGPGLFYVLVQGTRLQVDVAHQMLSSVLRTIQ